MARLVGAPEGPVELAEADYRRFVSDARNQMLTLAKASKPFTLDQSGNAGSIYGIGRREYQRQHGRLNLSRLRGIMAFDSTARTVTVAAKTDFKTLSRYLLDRGFIVPVVPEVDTVTVGGAISGVVMEAASFRHGFVHNTVQGMEVLLPDGQVVFCSREERPELFRAIPHSYGTLGYVLSAQLLVVPAEMEVMVTIQEVSTPKEAVDGISKAIRDPAVDFVEGILFGPDRALTMTASMRSPASLEALALPMVVLPDDGRYIDVVCKQLDTSRADWHSKNVSCAFRMSTFDFLYRWDCDIFWATRRTGFLGVPAVRQSLGRACLRSKVLWPVGTFLRGTKEVVSQLAWNIFGEAGQQLGFNKPTERIIQDLGVRFEQVPAFAKDLEAHAELPFWMCPIKCRGLVEEQPLFPLPEDADYVMDVASFGAVPQDMKSGDPLFHNRGIERVPGPGHSLQSLRVGRARFRLQKYDGMKAFYSDVLYSRKYLYKKFNGPSYDRLKSKFDPKGVLPTLVKSIVRLSPAKLKSSYVLRTGLCVGLGGGCVDPDNEFLTAAVSCAAALTMGLIVQSVKTGASEDDRSNLRMNATALVPLMERQRSIKAALEDCMAWLQALEAQKVEASMQTASTSLAPRFVRTVQRLDLTEKEVRALEHILVMQCLPEWVREVKFVMEMAEYAKLSPSEMLHFASKSRKHRKQGLIAEVTVSFLSLADVERNVEDEPLGTRAVLSPEAAKALTGGELSVAELLKVDESSALSEALREEGLTTHGAEKEAGQSAEGDEPPQDDAAGRGKKRRREADEHAQAEPEDPKEASLLPCLAWEGRRKGCGGRR
ncbi:unnamed protein product [Symbiodinium natans]|uniref:Delta(24)-sterol reductase n=1 Tax=Symbiodinium natans TaxID=878477 RepID=A0A812JPD5_9DINO|nr:unnamed protein product [Symbiodinium natans]